MDLIDRLAMTPRTLEEAHLVQPWSEPPVPPVQAFIWGAIFGIGGFLMALGLFL